MRLLIQRVTEASVSIEKQIHSEIGKGLLVFVGFTQSDTTEDVQFLCRKLVELRIFEDAAGKMNLSVKDLQGSLLVVSQFTLYADCRRGRSPDFIRAAPPQQAEILYNQFISKLENTRLTVKSGVFAAYMQIKLVNDGPVTIILDSQPA